MLLRKCAAKHTVLEVNPFVRSPLFKQERAKLGGQKNVVVFFYPGYLQSFLGYSFYEAAAALDSRMKSEALKLNFNLGSCNTSVNRPRDLLKDGWNSYIARKIEATLTVLLLHLQALGPKCMQVFFVFFSTSPDMRVLFSKP